MKVTMAKETKTKTWRADERREARQTEANSAAFTDTGAVNRPATMGDPDPMLDPMLDPMPDPMPDPIPEFIDPDPMLDPMPEFIDPNLDPDLESGPDSCDCD